MKIPTVAFQAQDVASAGIEVVELQSVYRRSPGLKVDPFKPHRVQFHHLAYITEGAGSHFIDFKRYPCQAGSFIFINKNQIHAFDLENQPQGLAILFTQEFIDSVRASIRVPVFSPGFYPTPATPVLTVDHTLKKSCENLLSEINSVARDELHDILLIQLLFTTLLLKLHRERPDPFAQQLSEVKRLQFSRFVSLIEEKFTLTRDVVEYAKMMGLSYKNLNQLCKLASNQTPKQFIDAYTVLEAKRRLAIERIQVTQLTYELGFDEVSNFIKYFKKQTLVTPDQFKASLER